MQVNVLGPQVKEVFENAKKVVIVLDDQADTDSSSLAASLFELFSSYNKKVTLIAKNPLPEAAAPLVKPENFKKKIDPKSLVISFDWQQHKLEKLSYQLEGSKFNLIISSKVGKIDPNQVSYSYRGEEFDLLVSVGINNLEKIYRCGVDQDHFNRVASINFDKGNQNTNFAKLNVVGEKSDSVCSTAANVFKEAGIALPTKTAEIMLFGMRIITNNFTNVSDPATFEGAAYCKRSMIPGMLNQGSSVGVAKVENKEDNEIPENWLSPKIYRSSRLS
jgi:nanoRNase/pAp phosphatase (c-di-AMP/oligoRNAs hydrolase)